MRLIVIEEKDIASLLDKLELTKLRDIENYAKENYDLIQTLHKHFHYNVVKFFQDQGAEIRR